MKRTRIVIFGIGSISKFLTEHIRSDIEIVAYLITNGSDYVCGKKTISIEQLKEMEYDYIVVAFGNSIKGSQILEELGIPLEKIVVYAYSGLDYQESVLQQDCWKILSQKMLSEHIPQLFDLPSKRYYVCGMNIQENQKVISRDFVREQTLALLADEIKRKQVTGSVAEIGVSQGIFARKINELFPDRRLYLFDTYTGLPEQDMNHAIQLGWGEKLYALSEFGTPEEDVLKAMPYRQRCVIKKGYFPDTFDLDEKFAFVSFDLDFYESTKKGLELVYPCLSGGGYIMVHDYNNLAFTETKEAVIDFCRENKVASIPIPDVAGSVVLVK